MWLFTNIGFFSIIETPQDIDRQCLTIRARVRSDLEALQLLYLPGMGAIQESDHTDYRYRARTLRRDLHKAMPQLIDGISYSNFKNEVCKTQGVDRADVYARVWSDLYEMQRMSPTYELDAHEVTHRIAIPATSNHCAIVLDPSYRVLVRVNPCDDEQTLFLHLQTRSVNRPQDDLLSHLYQVTGYRGKTAAKCVIPVQQGFEDWVSYTIQLDDLSNIPEDEMQPFKWMAFSDVAEMIAKVQDKHARKRDKDHIYVAASRMIQRMFDQANRS